MFNVDICYLNVIGVESDWNDVDDCNCNPYNILLYVKRNTNNIKQLIIQKHNNRGKRAMIDA